MEDDRARHSFRDPGGARDPDPADAAQVGNDGRVGDPRVLVEQEGARLRVAGCGRHLGVLVVHQGPDGALAEAHLQELRVLGTPRPDQFAQASDLIDAFGDGRVRVPQPLALLGVDAVELVIDLGEPVVVGEIGLALLTAGLHPLIGPRTEHHQRAERNEDEAQQRLGDGVHPDAHHHRCQHGQDRELLSHLDLLRLRQVDRSRAPTAQHARGTDVLHVGARRRRLVETAGIADRQRRSTEHEGITGADRDTRHAHAADEDAVGRVRVHHLDRLADLNPGVQLRYQRVGQPDGALRGAAHRGRPRIQGHLDARVGSPEDAQQRHRVALMPSMGRRRNDLQHGPGHNTRTHNQLIRRQDSHPTRLVGDPQGRQGRLVDGRVRRGPLQQGSGHVARRHRRIRRDLNVARQRVALLAVQDAELHRGSPFCSWFARASA